MEHEGPEEAGADGGVHFLDYSDGFRTVCMSKLIKLNTLKMCSLGIYLNKAVFLKFFNPNQKYIF